MLATHEVEGRIISAAHTRSVLEIEFTGRFVRGCGGKPPHPLGNTLRVRCAESLRFGLKIGITALYYGLRSAPSLRDFYAKCIKVSIESTQLMNQLPIPTTCLKSNAWATLSGGRGVSWDSISTKPNLHVYFDVDPESTSP